MLKQPAYLKHRNIFLKDLNSIYFDVPKVASTSLKTIFADLLAIPVDKNIHFLDFPYLDLKEQPNIESYFKFGFVRNPWDRLVSCYRNKIKSADFNSPFHVNGVARAFLKHNIFYGGMPFAQFVEAVISIPEAEADPHFGSQYLNFPMKEDLVLLDFIGKFERLATDYHLLAKKLDTVISLKHLNNNQRVDFRPYYTTDLIYKVYNRYRLDIHLFDYHFK